MAIIKCPECGHQVSDKAATCPSCGVSIAGNVMKCPECGAVVFKGQAMCPDCHCPIGDGAAAAAQGEPQPQAAKASAVQAAAEVGAAVVSGANQPENADGAGEPNEEKSHKKGYMAIAIAVVILLIVGFVCVYYYKNTQDNSELDAYEAAMNSKEPAELQNFLDLYKDAPEAHRDSIQAHLDILLQLDREWTDAVLSGSKTAIERFMQMHPGSNHETEAKIKIDSLDWVTASKADTPDAYQAYMSEHSDGLYYDQAKDNFEKVSARQVSPGDKQNISSLFNSYFTALAANDANALTSTLANVMDDFLHKANATKNDVVSYMHKIQSEADGGALSFRTNNDWKIDKKEASDGSGYEYTVAFSVDQEMPGKDGAPSSIVTYKIDAKVSSDGKISTLNMKKMVQ